MTKILAICGSAAKNSSTKKLLETALAAAAANGAQTEYIAAAKLTIHGCMGCNYCKKSDKKTICLQKDDMLPLYDKIQDSDIIILGSPIYFGDATGQMKCFIDRLYAFAGANGLTLKPGKKTAAVITQGYDDLTAYLPAADRMLSGLLHFGLKTAADPLVIGGLHTADDLTPDQLKAAETFGKKLLN